MSSTPAAQPLRKRAIVLRSLAARIDRLAVLSVHVLVGNFFCGRSTHRQHLDGKAQFLAGQRVVAVQVHDGAFDLQHVEDDVLTVVATAL